MICCVGTHKYQHRVASVSGAAEPKSFRSLDRELILRIGQLGSGEGKRKLAD